MWNLATRTDRRAAWLIMLLSVVLAGGVAGTSLSQRWLVDSSGLNSQTGIVGAVALGVLAHAVTVVLGRYRANLSQLLNDGVVLTLSHDLLSTTAQVETVEHLERPEYLNRLALALRGAHGVAAFCWTMAETGTSIVSLALSLWLLLGVHPSLVLLALCAIPPLWLGSRAERLVRRVKDESAEDHRMELSLHQLCLEVDPAMEIRVAGSGPDLSRRADALWEKMTSREAAARLRGIALQTLGWVFFAIGIVAALAIVAHLVHMGQATPGDIVLVITLGSQLRRQIASTLVGVRRVGEAGRVTDHYVWLREFARKQPRGKLMPPDQLHAGITLENVSFRHEGAGKPVLQEINLSLPAGSVIGLVGLNGAGKTTLVKLITGLYRPTAGHVRVDGLSMADLDLTSWMSRCSGTFQDFAKPQMLAREVVGIGDLRHLNDSLVVNQALCQAGASIVVDSLPNGEETQLGEVFNGMDLSHGQWQKLALARGSMRSNPLLLVLDEPTSALDPHTEHDLFEGFAVQARRASDDNGAVTLLVSHRFSTVHMADHIIVLADGRVVEQGGHSELLASGGFYADLYQAQARGYRMDQGEVKGGGASDYT
ncbi:ABC transporter ATP-binding protein [Streptomyces albidoflavus]